MSISDWSSDVCSSDLRPVAQQTQRDVHPDLGPPAGEQRALAAQVGALIALGVRERRALRAEPVIERIDEGVVLLAAVETARLEQGSEEGRVGKEGVSKCRFRWLEDN